MLQWNRSWSTLTGKIIFGFTTKLKLYWIHSNPGYIHICWITKQAKYLSEGLKPWKTIPTSGDEAHVFPSSQTAKQKRKKEKTKQNGNRLSVKKAAGKIKIVNYVIVMLLFYSSQIPTGKNDMWISVNKTSIYQEIIYQSRLLKDAVIGIESS